jgi:phage terminase Nu1 subunit (DNA packaging protein)
VGQLVKKGDIAAIFGYSLPTVDAWIKEGCPVKTEGGKGKAYQLDTEDVFRWLLQREKRPGRPSSRPPEGEVDPETGERKVSLEESTRRKAYADALKAELAFVTAKELVAPVEMIARVVSNEVANARARLLAIPSKLRPEAQVCAIDEDKARRIVAKVDDLIREAMNEIKSFGGVE